MLEAGGEAVSEPQVIVERYRHDHWGSRQDALRAVNVRISELRQERYVCEHVAGEIEDNGEVFRCELIRAIRFPEATTIRPEE